MRITHLSPALLGAALLGSFPSGLAAQAFEGILGLRIREAPAPVQAYVKGGRIRMEMQTPMGPGALIMNPDSSEQYLVMPSQQIYMVMKSADVAQLADSLARARGGGVGEGSLTATGRKETIAGHECEIHRYQGTRSVLDLCLASGLGSISQLGGLFRNPMGGMGMGPGAGRPAPAAGWLTAVVERDLFPLRVADSSGVAIWEVTSVEPKDLDAALFAPPANFQRMDMPGFGRRPPDDRSR